MSDQIRTHSETLVQVERTGAHSHIRGLGLDDMYNPKLYSQGLVGQLNARKSAGILVQMVKKQGTSGRGLLIAGQPGTGKTAIAIGMSRALGEGVPFVSMNASEVFSKNMNTSEVLLQNCRKAIGIRIKEESEVITGEVVEIKINRPTDGSGKKFGTITLKTTDMESDYDLGPKLIDQIQQAKVQFKDIISIDKNTGRVVKLGRSISSTMDFDATGGGFVKPVHTPEGELQKRKEVVHTVSLHEIDVINSGSQGFLHLFSGDTGEIKNEIRQKISNKVQEWKEEGKAEIIPGILFIDEVHMLDIECFSFLNKMLEDPLTPLVVMASNRGITTIRGTEHSSPHGIPLDLLDRCLIISTQSYTEEELFRIITIRCEEEDVKINESALKFLTKIASEKSLRYGLQLISVANACCKRRKGKEVTRKDIKRVYNVFIDTIRSTEFLQTMDHKYLFNERSNDDGQMDEDDD